MSAHVYLSSAFHGWRTPPFFLELVRQVGPIALDPCTTRDNPTGAARIYVAPASPFDSSPCGLSSPWWAGGLVYANPRYGRYLRGPVRPRAPVLKTVDGVKRLEGFGTGWVAKMCEHRGEGLYLVPSRTDTTWWRELYAWCDWLVQWSSAEHGSRIHFIDPATGEQVKGSNLPSSVFYRGPRAQAFCEAFAPHGTLHPGAKTLQTLLRLHYTTAERSLVGGLEEEPWKT